MTDNKDTTIEDANAGNAHAQWLLGCAYWYGEEEEEIGIAQDQVEAMIWFERAARQGNEDALRAMYSSARQMEQQVKRLGKNATDDMHAIASYGDVAVELANGFDIDLTKDTRPGEDHDAPSP